MYPPSSLSFWAWSCMHIVWLDDELVVQCRKSLPNFFFTLKLKRCCCCLAVANFAILFGKETRSLLVVVCSTTYYVCNSSLYLMVGSRNAKHYQQFGSKTRTKKEDGKVVHTAAAAQKLTQIQNHCNKKLYWSFSSMQFFSLLLILLRASSSLKSLWFSGRNNGCVTQPI